MKYWFLVFILFFATIACQNAPDDKASGQPAPTPEEGSGDSGDSRNKAEPLGKVLRVSVMAYNLENLFDNVKDASESDYTPEPVLQKKLAQVAKGILQISGVGPDVLLVEEVENLNVLEMLNKDHLKAAGYRTISLLESDDERGIDVGVFSRFKLAGPAKLHKMPFSHLNRTRGILEVPLELPGGKVLRVFANHFPSQSNPVIQRRQAAEFLRDLMASAPAGDYVLAGGDFNITGAEEAKERFFHQTFKNFQVSHLIGCQSCVGTYAYKSRWDFLDALITREPVLDSVSIRTPNQAPTQLRADGTPYRFDPKKGEGISDHLPIYGELTLKVRASAD